MLEFNVKTDFREVERMLTKSQRTILPKATSSALNKVATSVQKEAIRILAKDIGLPQKEIRKYLFITKATWRNLESSIKANGKRIPVHKLNAKQIRRGVKYKGQDGKRRLIPGAFMKEIRVQGVPGAYKRRGKDRFPVVFLRTVSIPHVYIKDATNKAMLRVAKVRWGKVWPHEVRYRLQKAGYN